MAHLQLRGKLLTNPAGQPHLIEAMLFDKDGTLSVSEPMLHALASARVFHCQALLAAHHPGSSGEDLEGLLQRAYGLGPAGVHPAGTTAVASRSHNLISTATVLAQIGLGWPEALALSEATFAATDGLHGMGSVHAPQVTNGLRPLLEQLNAAGVSCAVISNDEVAGIEAFLASRDLQHHFSGLWSAEHSPCKPDPGAVLGLCAALGIAPQRCALIGDANSDLRMARSAGLPVVLGYTAAWSSPPPLDPTFPSLGHWQELEANTPA